MSDEVAEWTSIRIESPLPMGVAGALLQAIGQMWPEARIVTGYGSTYYALNVEVPKVTAQDLDDEFAAALRQEADGRGGDGQFEGFRDGWVAFAPPEELCLQLGQVAHAIFTAHQPQAINYVEWQIRTGNGPDDPEYQLSIAKSKAQTPGELRKKAEAENERLRALLEKHGIDPEEGT